MIGVRFLYSHVKYSEYRADDILLYNFLKARFFQIHHLLLIFYFQSKRYCYPNKIVQIAIYKKT